MYCVVQIFVIFLLFNITNELEVLETVEAIVGDYAEIPCNVTAENEDADLNFLAWYRNDSSTAFYSRDLRGGNSNTVSPPDGRYQLITSPTGMDYLQIDRVLPSDAGVYQCVVEFALSPTHKTIVELIVIDPPHHLWVILENGTQVAKTSAGVNISQNIGPYYIGDTVHLLCVAFGGTPRPSLSWLSEQRLLKNTSSPLSEQRVRSDLLYGPLREEDHGRVLSCLANNNHRTLPLVIDIIIDMILPPDLITIRAKNLLPAQSDVSTGWLVGSAEVHDGNTLLLQCRELGARPIPTLEWKIDGNDVPGLDPNITEEQTQRHVVSEIELKVTHKLDEAQITCCTPANKRDGQDSVCAVPIFLTVLYPPVLKIFVDQEPDNGTLALEKGSNLTLGCSFVANPNVNQLAWFHEEDLISESKYNNTVLELKDLKESDAGEYVCAGTNSEGSTYSDPLNIDITYAYCEEDVVVEYGIRENESIDLTCKVKANPEATSFRWVIVNEEVNASTLQKYPNTTVETAESTMSYKRPNDSAYSTIFCWGVNGIPSQGTPCTFAVTDQTIPRPPIDCVATKSDGNIVLSCQEGHNGGLPQRFNMSVKSLSNEQIVTVVDFHPKFIIPEPKQHQYKIVISAFNDKGPSQPLEISQDEIVVDEPLSAVTNITTLSLALCGGVLLIALVACGLVLCAHDRGSRLDLPRAHSDPPLCAYSSEGDYPKMNCDVHGSDDGSECNVRRTESFRRAVSRYPSKNFDVRRTSSFHSTRYMNDVPDEAMKYDNTRHNTNCRVHSLQNINKKREMDMLCDHLVLHMPPEPNYNVPRPMNTFYTMPRKMRHKLTKELSDDRSEITQTSDGFSLPPPPDEFGTYRAGTRIKDIPKTTPTYSTVRKNSTKESSKHQYNASPMNSGLPTVSGQTSLYTYPDDHGHQVNTNPFDDDST